MMYEDVFDSYDKKSRVHRVKWLPEKKHVAVLQLVHGMKEYILRYQEFALFMAERGFLVAGHDHIGHGYTATDVGNLGEMDTGDPCLVMVEDIYTHYRMLEEEYPGIPHFIMGHSMGSYMVRRFLSEKSQDLGTLKGAILMGTGTESDMTLYAGRIIVNLVKSMKSRNYRSDFVKGLMFGPPYKQFNLDGSLPEKSWLSTDVERVTAYYRDPYCTFDFTVNGYKALVDATIYDNKISNIQKIRKDLPVLFISGTMDPVGGLGKGVRKAADKFEKAGLSNVSVKMYEGLRHELLHEIGRETIFKDIFEWLIKV